MKDGVASNIGWKTAERILAQGVSFVVSIVLARILSPNDYGIVAIVLIFISLADVFVNSGFATALIQKHTADEIDFSTMFYCSLVSSLLIYAVLFLLAPIIAAFYQNDFLIIVIRVFSLKIPLSTLNSIQHAYVSRNMLFKKFFWSTLFGTILSGIVGIVMAINGFGVWSLIAQYFTNMIVDTLILFVTIKWRPRRLFSFDAAKSLMSYGWKILVADLSGTFFGQLRSLIIGKFYTSEDLAYYNRGQQIPNLVYNNIGTSIMAVLFPAMSNYSDDVEKVKNMTRKAMRCISFILLPMLLGIAATAPQFIRLLLTDKWEQAIPFVQILCISYAVASLGIGQFQALKAIGRSDVVLKLEFVKKPVFVILLIIGVLVSPMMVATTMVIYDLYGIVVNSIAVKKYLHYSFFDQMIDVLPTIILASVMSVCVLLFTVPQLGNLINLIIKIFLGTTIYFFAAYIFRFDAYKQIKERLLGAKKKNVEI